jgi:hypothetical protein
MDLTARNTRGFNQHVTGFRHRLAGQMINHIRLIFIRRKADHLSALRDNASRVMTASCISEPS